MPQLCGLSERLCKRICDRGPHNRFLYLVEATGVARRYGAGVGRAGLAWSGTAKVARKAKWLSWTPTKNMIKRSPEKYGKYAGGVAGGPRNPLGSLSERSRYLLSDSWHDGAVDDWACSVQRLHSNAQRARCRSLRTRPDRNDRCCSVTQRKMLLSTFVRRPAAALQWIWHSKRNANPGASCRDLLACWRISPTHGASRRGCQRYSCADA